MRKHRHSVTDEPAKLAGIAALSAAIGAITALVLAPRNGKQMRADLMDKAAKVKNTVHDKLDNNIEEAGDTADDTKERLQTTANKAANSAKKTTRTAKTEAKSTARTAKKAADKKDS